ncbi:DUF397 domain-containing protein [Streptomyces sp. MspMP-M5]|uniref:DUF397 domain-containing protein n=1 Tax=unclassified Streptomyces TaxID=2593676 RepID=UPI000371BB6A|nr:DUF397 domain-containing protein [Streptomyces sp. MspMP-M5]MYT34258.1 DUF397 domain-containing protein [Streptomyces sp. SID8354]
MTEPSPRWIKSSYSENGGQCIEVATNLVPSHGVVPVRDSKTPTGPTFAVPAESFSAFIAAVKNDAFDAL